MFVVRQRGVQVEAILARMAKKRIALWNPSRA